MADAQKFLVTKPAGKPRIGASDVTHALHNTITLGVTVGVVEVDASYGTTPPSFLCWRVKRNNITVASTDSADNAAKILVHLADDLTEWSVTFEMDQI